CDNGAQSRTHGFEETDRRPLATRRHREERESGVQRLRVIAPTEQMDVRRYAPLLNHSLEMLTVAAFSSEHEDRLTPLAPSGEESREGVDHHVIALDVLQS